MIIAIDNGVSGGLVAMSKQHGQIISKIAMPVKKVLGKNAVDARAVYEWCFLTTHGKLENADYLLERPVGSKSAAAGISMSGSFHALRGMLESRRVMIAYPQPRTWQKALRCDSDANKSKAIMLAQKLWPDEDWTPTERATKPHTGLVDAALIAHWYRGLDIPIEMG